MRQILSLFSFAAVAFASSASTVPPELAVIGEPYTVLNLTFAVGSKEKDFHPGEFLDTTSMHELRPPSPSLRLSSPLLVYQLKLTDIPKFQSSMMHHSRTCMAWV